MSHSKVIRGAALNATIERQTRELLAPWGLPMDAYKCEVERENETTLAAKWTHTETGAEIVISSIWYGDDGEIMQVGANYGALTF